MYSAMSITNGFVTGNNAEGDYDVYHDVYLGDDWVDYDYDYGTWELSR